jgi:hypothetical protein
MSRRPRGAYIGGHTIIGPGSGWFSKSEPKKSTPIKATTPLTPRQIAKKEKKKIERQAAEQQRKRDAQERLRVEREAAAERKRAKIAAQNTPEAIAQRAEKASAVRVRLERRMEGVTVVRRQLRTAPKLTTKDTASSQEERMPTAKSASKPRGAVVRKSRPRITRREEYSRTHIVLTAAEYCHFSLGSIQEHRLLAELRPVVRVFARGGIRKPHEVARALNRAGKRTACGEQWTPRLVWFLLSKMFASGSSKPVRRGAARPDRPPSAGMPNRSASATKRREPDAVPPRVRRDTGVRD